MRICPPTGKSEEGGPIAPSSSHLLVSEDRSAPGKETETRPEIIGSMIPLLCKLRTVCCCVRHVNCSPPSFPPLASSCPVGRASQCVFENPRFAFTSLFLQKNELRSVYLCLRTWRSFEACLGEAGAYVGRATQFACLPLAAALIRASALQSILVVPCFAAAEILLSPTELSEPCRHACAR